LILGILHWELVNDNVIKRDCFIFEGAGELRPSVKNRNFKTVLGAERLSILNLNGDVMLHDFSDVS
jgi:hypothetical protein